MAKKISLIVGAREYLSPCAGNDEFEELYRNKLKPFITVLNKFPKMQAVLHYSGPLLSRLEQKKPEFLLLIGDLVARRQLEMLGGAFYEPPLPLLSVADRIGQIEKLTTYLRQQFGKKPQGCVLANGAWEQSLVGVLRSCGLLYTFLSEIQCRTGGMEDLYSPVFTEDQGKLTMVFPVLSFGETGEGDLARWAQRGVTVRGIASELRRYVPDRRERSIVTVFPQFPEKEAGGAMELFCEELLQAQAEKDWEPVLELSTPGRVYRSLGSLPRFYFPGSMAKGPAGEFAYPRRFLTADPRSNALYAKICFVHSQISQLRGDKARKRVAQEELWKAQGMLCQNGNLGADPADLNRYAYKSLIAAEKIIREKGFTPSLLVLDFDLDGASEYLLQDKNLNCYVKTEGAALFELDHIPKGRNYLDSSGEGRAFMDCLLPAAFIGAENPAEQFSAGRFCGGEEYAASVVDRQKSRAVFRLPPKKNLPFGQVEIEKIYQLEKNLLTLCYTLTNRGEEPLDCCLCPRMNFSPAAGGERFYAVFRADGTGRELLAGGSWTSFAAPPAVHEESAAAPSAPAGNVPASPAGPPVLELADLKNGVVLSITSEQPYDFFFYPPAETCRSVSFLPAFRISLDPGGEWKNRFSLSIVSGKRPA
jgi:hypothetical protein